MINIQLNYLKQVLLYYRMENKQVSGITLTDIEKDAKRFVNSLRENKQMTRKEAYDKLPVMEQMFTRNHFLNSLEALGLIKFEEEVKIPELHYVLKSLNIRDGIIGDLFSKGYEIRKIGVYDHG
mgnify:CR=1 FL=1